MKIEIMSRSMSIFNFGLINSTLNMTTRGSAMDPRNVPTIFGLATGEEK